MGRKSMPPLSSQPESVKAKLGTVLSCAPALTATPTATEAISAAPHSKDLLNIACSLSGVLPAVCVRDVALYHKAFVARMSLRGRSRTIDAPLRTAASVHFG